MINLLCIFLFSTTTFSLKSMEISTRRLSNSKKSENAEVIVKKKFERKIKKSSSFSFSRKSIETDKSTIHSLLDNIEPEHPFIIATYDAIKSKDYTAIQFYLSNPHLDPNIKGLCGCPSFMIFAQANLYEVLQLFLDDYRTDFSKRDMNNLFITDYIDKCNNAFRELRHKVFIRFTFDMVTNYICKKILYCYTEGKMDNTILTEIKKRIKDKVIQDAHNQNESADRHIPLSACFPEEYATEPFMTNKVWYTLNQLSLKNS